MHFKILLIISALALFLACGPKETPKNTNTTAVPNVNVPNTTTTSPVSNTKPEAAKTNEAESLKPVVSAYYEALKKKDDAGLRKIYSAETLKTLEEDMKAEKKSSLSEYISELEPAPVQPFEVRNEEIKGEAGIAEIKGGAYVNWTKIKFVKEAGAWKMTDESPEFDSVKSAANSTK
jgi:hypothetical protein